MEWCIVIIILLVIIIIALWGKIGSLKYDLSKLTSQEYEIEKLEEENKKLKKENEVNKKLIQSIEKPENIDKSTTEVFQYTLLLWNKVSKNLWTYRNLFAGRYEYDLIEFSRYLEYLFGKYKLLESAHSNLTAIPYMASIMADYKTYVIEEFARKLDWGKSVERAKTVKSIREIRETAKKIIEENLEAHYKIAYLNQLFPQLSDVLNKDFNELDLNNINVSDLIKSVNKKNSFEDYIIKIYTDNYLISENIKLTDMIEQKDKEIYSLTEEKNILFEEINNLKKNLNSFEENLKSNITAIPYMATLIADYETYGLEKIALKLDWGNSSERAKKVKSIREIRKDAKAIVEKNKEAQYQLAYLLNLFPNLSDIIDCEFNQLPIVEIKDLSDYDTTRDYLSKEEYSALTVTERNQLALDRYKNSHSKSKWQIGRDYELYVGYRYNQKGYIVEYFGSEKRLEDMGRDLIAFKGGKTLIVQCKYWSSEKLIHEKHVMQLYGTMVSYCIENEVDKNKVHGVLVTNISLSETAKKVAEYLNIEYKENFEKGDYPCIKCNIGKDENGKSTKIYHLPFDQQYDSTIIHGPDEFFAMTVAEAENAGFRRAFKWFGSK